MSWIQKLYETYERCAEGMNIPADKLWPVSHLVKKAHIEVVLDGQGNFRSARKLGRTEAPTLIPATESSAGRSGAKIAPHPLCEEISYCASDFPKADEKRFTKYEEQLAEWCSSENVSPKALAILTYVRHKRLWTDLCKEQIFPVTVEDAKGKKTKVSDSKVFVRWRVDIVGSPTPGTWEDAGLIKAWIDFDRKQNNKRGLCMVTGKQERICQSHSRFIRSTGDGAKLISANDFSGYTFRGRFTDSKDDYGKQTCSVGYEVSQKAHNALRWLIARQGFRDRNSDQAIIAWDTGGKEIPDPVTNSADLFDVDVGEIESEPQYHGDAGQAFALRLNNCIRGYRAKLGLADDIVVMGLDSATKGRMAITYYRELNGSEFLDRVEAWHKACAWAQNYSKKMKFVGAPSPKDIAEAAYGRQLVGDSGKKLSEATVERLLPCIIDGQPIPRDLVELSVNRAANRAGHDKWEFDKQLKTEVNTWEKNLGIACALFKGYNKDRSYQMTLETNRTSRDYLYGRLLAIAENLEGKALYIAGEKRDTNAAKLMQRFADHPYSTWRTIELTLTPYKTRLRSKRAPFLREMELLLDEVTCALGDAYTNDSRLTGEFLLGYHCQRQALRPPAKKDTPDQSNETQEGE